VRGLIASVAGAGLVLLGTPAALPAAAAAGCRHQVTDPAGDVTAPHDDATGLERSLDITALDVGADAASLLALVHVKAIEPEEAATADRSWSVWLGLGTERYELRAFKPGVGAPTYELRRVISGDDQPSQAGVSTVGTRRVAWVAGRIDAARDVVVIQVPRRAFAPSRVRGLVDGIHAQALGEVSNPPTPAGYWSVYPLQDQAGSGSYRVGSAYCRN
jgi:hypothetical protein